MRKSEHSTGSRLLKAGVAVAATAVVVAGVATPANAASVAMTLSATTGPTAGGNTITGTTATAVFTGTTYRGLFTVTACPANYTTTAVTPTATAGVVVAGSTDVKKLTTTKVTIKVPAGVVLPVGSSTPLKYNVCVYNGSTAASAGPPIVVGSALVATASYTIAKAPTIASTTWVNPGSGPALGGTAITVTGTNFTTTGLTATIGGTPLTGIVVATDGTSFTAVTPAHVATTGATLAITTSGGTASKAGSFDFLNGISVVPNTAPTGTSADVDVQGAGLGDMFAGWSTPADSLAASPHIYLVAGVYDATAAATKKTLGPLQDCGGVAVIGPTEVVCTFDLANSLDDTGATSTTDVLNGTYTVTVVNDGAVGANTTNDDYLATILTSGSTFTVAPY
jgi:hypothetical protein